MSVLVDHEINSLLSKNPTLVTNVPPNAFSKAEDRIQAASLDLTIGEIFTPARERAGPGDVDAPFSELTLLQGHTAVVRTLETLNLGPDLIAIGFPPASMSVRGLLITNPGLVDPGYHGPLHLTVINMSQVPFQLRKGDRIIRVIFINLTSKPSAPYDLRHPGMNKSPITAELLARLSSDFLDVERRSKKIANEAITKAQLWSAGISALIVVLTVVLLPFLSEDKTAALRDAVDKLEAKISLVDGRLDAVSLEPRMKNLRPISQHYQPRNSEQHAARLSPVPANLYDGLRGTSSRYSPAGGSALAGGHGGHAGGATSRICWSSVLRLLWTSAVTAPKF